MEIVVLEQISIEIPPRIAALDTLCSRINEGKDTGGAEYDGLTAWFRVRSVLFHSLRTYKRPRSLRMGWRWNLVLEFRCNRLHQECPRRGGEIRDRNEIFTPGDSFASRRYLETRIASTRSVSSVAKFYRITHPSETDEINTVRVRWSSIISKTILLIIRRRSEFRSHFPTIRQFVVVYFFSFPFGRETIDNIARRDVSLLSCYRQAPWTFGRRFNIDTCSFVSSASNDKPSNRECRFREVLFVSIGEKSVASCESIRALYVSRRMKLSRSRKKQPSVGKIFGKRKLLRPLWIKNCPQCGVLRCFTGTEDPFVLREQGAPFELVAALRSNYLRPIYFNYEPRLLHFERI